MPKALFYGVYESLKQAIESSVYSYQSFLMSENDLRKQYSCSRSTIRRALSELARDGYVQPIQGKGVRVIWHPESEGGDVTSPGDVLESFAEKGRRMGFHAKNCVLSFEHVIADARIARTTGFAEGDRLVQAKRLRMGDGIPVATERLYVLEDEIPGLSKENLEESLYAYVERDLGLQVTTNKRSIVVEQATDEDRELIQIPDTLPAVAVIRAQSFDSNGVMFEWSEERQHPYFFMYFDTVVRAVRPAQ